MARFGLTPTRICMASFAREALKGRSRPCRTGIADWPQNLPASIPAPGASTSMRPTATGVASTPTWKSSRRRHRPPQEDEEATSAYFSASWTKSVGIAHVTYSISVEGGADTAVFSDDLSEGTIQPPAPFHGQATIRRQGEGWEWSGSLSARFPGRTVHLTGPGFEPLVTTFNPRPYTFFAFAYDVRC